MAQLGDEYDIRRTRFEGGAVQIEITGGRKTVERIVPPAGEKYAFDSVQWEHRLTVYVSPQGRSFRLFIDGTEHKLERRR